MSILFFFRGGTSVSAMDEAARCVKLYCMDQEGREFHACYGRCLDFVGTELFTKPEKRVMYPQWLESVDEPGKRQVDPKYAELFVDPLKRQMYPQWAENAQFTEPGKRQVDPLQSCIEAKCAGIHSGRYGNCIYRRCITGVYKTKRSPINNLILSSSYLEPSLEDILKATYLEKEAKKLRNNDELKKLRGDDLTISDLLIKSYSKSHHSVGGLTLSQVLSGGAGSASKKRSWNDIIQNCIMFHCRQDVPGSTGYNICVQVHCSKVALGRREAEEDEEEK